MMPVGSRLLQVKDLSVDYHQLSVVKQLELQVGERQTVVIVGESGSGKSTLLRSILGLLGGSGRISSGDIVFKGRSLLHLSEDNLRAMRGADIAMIFQNPEAFLDPRMRIQDQFLQAVRVHRQIGRKQALGEAASLLGEMQFADPFSVLRAYPFELSGGMCQRVAIAMAMVNRPKLLLADEPTSALDVTVQAEVINLLVQMQRQYDLSILLVTHNMLVVEKMADMVGVMHRGQLVEWGTKHEVLQDARHPYTRALLQAVPRLSVSSQKVSGNLSACERVSAKGSNAITEDIPVAEAPGRIFFSPTHWIAEE